MSAKAHIRQVICFFGINSATSIVAENVLQGVFEFTTLIKFIIFYANMHPTSGKIKLPVKICEAQ